ncbi:MAG TPA: DUF3300 domain-containing protein [Verrucomicrobiae bacterium]|nr:DUF3300 domain-containing protein [Verrucomicrobiae bacterium]
MNSRGEIPAGSSQKQWWKRSLVFVLSVGLLFVTLPLDSAGAQDQQAPPAAQTPQGPPYTTQTPDQLQQLVAPIALYPDSLVAQILAASTFPEEVVEADRWVQAHPDLKGAALGQAVNNMSWDASVKALCAFPDVLGNMDKNLSWTSSLGDAYYNQPQDVMDAIQVMRQKAEAAGNLKTTPQQTVTTQGQTIVIQPAQPDVVYVPAYNPWIVYGPPIVAWPGWYPYPGIWFGGGPFLSFGVGFGIGFFAGFGWGWPHWGFDWHNHWVVYNHNRYWSHSTTFYNRNVYYRGGHGGPGAPGFAHAPAPGRGYAGERGNVYNRPGASPRPFEGDHNAARGYAPAPAPHNNVVHSEPSMHSGAFSGYDHGGESRSYSARGSSSFHGGGGGGGSHGGGGGHH